MRASPFRGIWLFSLRQRRSELKFERELDRAWAPNLIKRIEAAVGATRTETVRQRLRRTAEERASQDVRRTAEVRVIEDIEKLSTKTKSQSLSEVKLTLHSDVRLPRPKTSQHIASEITLGSSRRRTKSGAIENLPAGKLRAVGLKRNARVYVRTRRELRARREETTANNIHRRG